MVLISTASHINQLDSGDNELSDSTPSSCLTPNHQTHCSSLSFPHTGCAPALFELVAAVTSFAQACFLQQALAAISTNSDKTADALMLCLNDRLAANECMLKLVTATNASELHLGRG